VELTNGDEYPMNLVTADIGGTHARFALAEVAGGRVVSLGEAVTLPTAQFASLQTAWEEFGRQAGPLPRAAAIAIAAAIEGDAIKLTNNPWVIRPSTIGAALGLDRQVLVNDFEAVGHAVAQVEDDHLVCLCGPKKPLPDQGVISIVGPGTGLGVSYVLRSPALGAGGYHVQATEGGHADFASVDRIEDAILDRIRQRHRRVSSERIVAGPAIVDIYEALAALEGRSVPTRTDKEIWALGLAREDSLAVAAVERFCLSLGSVAGDVALVQGAEGVVIAGGLGLRIKETLLASGFGQRFRAKGRFEPMMSKMPVKLLVHPQPGLFGAAAAFAQATAGEMA
jgi:glucokinase